MPHTFTSPIQYARLSLWNDKAWLWYATIPRKAGGAYRIVRASRHVVSGGLAWQACGFDLQVAPTSLDGQAGQVGITVPNVSRLVGAAIETTREFLGQELVIYVSLEGQSYTAGMQYRQIVTQAQVSETAVVLQCADPVQLKQVPGKRFTPSRWPGLSPVSAARTRQGS